MLPLPVRIHCHHYGVKGASRRISVLVHWLSGNAPRKNGMAHFECGKKRGKRILSDCVLVIFHEHKITQLPGSLFPASLSLLFKDDVARIVLGWSEDGGLLTENSRR